MTRACASAERPFDEGAAQVRRLLERDVKEMTGIEEIGSAYRTEFDEDGGSAPASTSTKAVGGAGVCAARQRERDKCPCPSG